MSERCVCGAEIISNYSNIIGYACGSSIDYSLDRKYTSDVCWENQVDKYKSIVDSNGDNKVILMLQYLGYDPPQTLSDQIDLYEEQADMIRQGIQHEIRSGMIDNLCDRYGVSLRKLAKMVHVSPSYLSLCKNVGAMSFDVFKRLEALFHE